MSRCIRQRPPARSRPSSDVGPQLLLTRGPLLTAARDIAGELCEVLDIDAPADAGPDGAPAIEVGPDAPSTLFYTSGTTGTPKGVVKSHRAVLHRVWLSAVYDGVTQSDRQSLLTHCSFSASESDIFGALLQGVTLCVFDIANQGLTTFRDWLAGEHITLLHPPVRACAQRLRRPTADPAHHQPSSDENRRRILI